MKIIFYLDADYNCEYPNLDNNSYADVFLHCDKNGKVGQVTVCDNTRGVFDLNNDFINVVVYKHNDSCDSTARIEYCNCLGLLNEMFYFASKSPKDGYETLPELCVMMSDTYQTNIEYCNML